MLTLFTAAAVLAACAGLRWFLNRPERKDVFFWGGRIRLTALWNDGAAFSLPLKRKLVTALSILVLPLVWEMCIRDRYPHCRIPPSNRTPARRWPRPFPVSAAQRPRHAPGGSP